MAEGGNHVAARGCCCSGNRHGIGSSGCGGGKPVSVSYGASGCGSVSAECRAIGQTRWIPLCLRGGLGGTDEGGPGFGLATCHGNDEGGPSGGLFPHRRVAAELLGCG